MSGRHPGPYNPAPMPAGFEFRLERGDLALRLGAGSELSEIRGFCSLQGAEGMEIAGSRWRQAGPSFVSACGPLRVRLEHREARRAGSLRLRLTVTAAAPVLLQSVGLRVTPAVGGGRVCSVAHSGYQSWDAAGMADVGGNAPVSESWWTCGLVGEHGALGLAARSATRVATCFKWWDGRLAVLHCAPPALGRSQPLWQAKAGSTLIGAWIELAVKEGVGDALLAAAGGPSHRRRTPPRGWLSWYHHGAWITKDEVTASAAALRSQPFAAVNANVVQIDDGWQVAYGDWTANTKFAPIDGLCAEIKARGQVPGIWTAPFLVSAASDLRQQAPASWFLRDAGGSLAVDPRHYVFGPMHVLDAGRREVAVHLDTVFRGLREAGFEYFKIDFLYAGAYAGLKALRAGVAAIRRAIGPDAYLLACGAPLLPVRGLVDGCRIGPDTCTPLYDFETGTSRPTFFGEEIQAVARAVALRAHLQAWYELDPDVALAGGLEAGKARQLVTAVALAGGLYFLGDALSSLEPWRAELVANPEIGELSRGGAARPDLRSIEGSAPPTVWTRADGLLAVFNWGREVAVHRLGLGRRAAARDLWNHRDLTVPGGLLELEIPPEDVRVVRLGRGRL